MKQKHLKKMKIICKDNKIPIKYPKDIVELFNQKNNFQRKFKRK